MSQPSIIHNTFTIERSYPAPPERVFAAFADPKQKQLWFLPGENKTVEEFTLDFRVGGLERAKYSYNQGTPFPGVLFTNEGSYQDIVPNRRIVAANTMAMSGRRFSAALITFELLPTDKGTDLIFTHQGAYFEGADGPKIREAGWQKLLESLATHLSRQAVAQ